MKVVRVPTVLVAVLMAWGCWAEVAPVRPAGQTPSSLKSTATPTGQATPRKLRGVTAGGAPRKLDADAVAGIEFTELNEKERLQNYRRINYDLRVYEDEYTNCISEIESLSFSQDAVDACTGHDMVKVALDIKYVTMRTMSKMDTQIRELFVEQCFKPHLNDEMTLVGCDIMERDARNLMWAGLNFFLILEANKQKYMFEYAKLSFELFSHLLERLTAIGHEFFELMNEIDNHKEVTILRLKTLIDDKFRLHKEDEEAEGVDDSYKVTHVIEVEEPRTDLPGFHIQNQHESQFNTEGGYEDRRQRELGARPPIDQDARPSANRIFNANGKYSGLHNRGGDGRMFAQSAFPKNQALRMSLVGRLSASDRAQARVPFKNIHTRHYSG